MTRARLAEIGALIESLPREAWYQAYEAEGELCPDGTGSFEGYFPSTRVEAVGEFAVGDGNIDEYVRTVAECDSLLDAQFVAAAPRALMDLYQLVQQLQAENTGVIRVWRFEDAPSVFRNLSTNGGDEDWVAHIPGPLADDYIGWMEEGSSFGCCCVDEFPLADGSVVRIGSHA